MLADRYVERLKHEIHQEIESYKTRLKKSEFLFQKQFEAASQFISLHRGLLPHQRFPDMEWSVACEDFAENFSKVEKALERYMAIHGAALNQDTLKRLLSAIDMAAAGKFDRLQDGTLEQSAIDSAEKVMTEFEGIEKELREAVWLQSST